MAIKTHAFTRPAAASSSSRSKVLSDVLRKQATDYGEIRHPMQGLDMLAKTALAAHLQRKETAKEEKLDFDVQQTFDEAMRAYTGSPAETTDGIDWQAQAPDPQRAAQIISKVDRGLSYEMSKAYADQARKTISAEEERKRAEATWQRHRKDTQADRLAVEAAKNRDSAPSGYRRTEGGLEPIPGGPAKSTMADRKLELLNKWRGAQDGRTEWTDADQAEWDMIIRADPMDILRRNMLQGMGRDPATPTSSPDSDAPPSTGEGAEPPGILDRIGNYFSGSGGQPAREIDGPTRPIPRDARGGVDAARLVAGQAYERRDGTRWLWDGQNFTEAQ